ncbi:hypothetical protein BC830DRAFT_1108195 [Chytriomyces sp. MP71]|nr:hypothetical protein BC830DRAFT_1108195 [Chytriomyces sp. MP71]
MTGRRAKTGPEKAKRRQSRQSADESMGAGRDPEEECLGLTPQKARRPATSSPAEMHALARTGDAEVTDVTDRKDVKNRKQREWELENRVKETSVVATATATASTSSKPAPEANALTKNEERERRRSSRSVSAPSAWWEATRSSLAVHKVSDSPHPRSKLQSGPRSRFGSTSIPASVAPSAKSLPQSVSPFSSSSALVVLTAADTSQGDQDTKSILLKRKHVGRATAITTKSRRNTRTPVIQDSSSDSERDKKLLNPSHSDPLKYLADVGQSGASGSSRPLARRQRKPDEKLDRGNSRGSMQMDSDIDQLERPGILAADSATKPAVFNSAQTSASTPLIASALLTSSLKRIRGNAAPAAEKKLKSGIVESSPHPSASSEMEEIPNMELPGTNSKRLAIKISKQSSEASVSSLSMWVASDPLKQPILTQPTSTPIAIGVNPFDRGTDLAQPQTIYTQEGDNLGNSPAPDPVANAATSDNPEPPAAPTSSNDHSRDLSPLLTAPAATTRSPRPVESTVPVLAATDVTGGPLEDTVAFLEAGADLEAGFSDLFDEFCHPLNVDSTVEEIMARGIVYTEEEADDAGDAVDGDVGAVHTGVAAGATVCTKMNGAELWEEELVVADSEDEQGLYEGDRSEIEKVPATSVIVNGQVFENGSGPFALEVSTGNCLGMEMQGAFGLWTILCMFGFLDEHTKQKFFLPKAM